MRHATVVTAVLSLLACGPEDLAGFQPMPTASVHELSHTISVRFEAGAATLKVKRVLRNDSDAVETYEHHDIALPEGSIATALRIGRGAELPTACSLSTKEDVSARWDLLTSPGEAAPAPIGRLEWSRNGGLDLDLFGLLPSETVTVEYDVEVPPRYEAGVLLFDVPHDGTTAPRFEGAAVEETVDGFVVRRQHHTDAVADVRWATSQLDTNRTLWRFEVDAAPELSRAPVAPSVVFVIDASHSEGPEGIAAQLELIAPYLVNAPDAKVEVVLTRRFAERLFGRFVPAREVAALLAAVPPERLAPGNGSNLDVGAALAAQLVSREGGPGRVLLFTDERLRDGFSNDATIRSFDGAHDLVVHVVARRASDDGSLREARNDEADLAPIATATGGIFTRVTGSPDELATAAKTLLNLVRPVRIDDFTVEATGLDLSVERELSEGSMVRLRGIDATPPESLTVSGKVWAREFRRTVTVDSTLARRLPGMAIGDDDLRGGLSDDELRTAAFLAHAISPVTSFMFVTPGAAPSTAGVVEGCLGLGMMSLHGLGCSGSFSSRCGFGFGRKAIDFESLLRQLLAPGAAACEARTGEPATATVGLDATGDEVVSVTVTGATPAMTECLTEATWAIRLSSEFQTTRTYSAELKPTR